MPDTVVPSASIALPPSFHFDEVKSVTLKLGPLPVQDFPPPLGALADFTGTWTGSGFNMIFRPQSTQTPTPLPTPGQGPADNILELNLTSESLAFSPSLGRVPNRGMDQGDIFLNGIPYLQTVTDVTDPNPANHVGIHAEPGLWMIVPSTTAPNEPTTLVRMASIPHGTTIMLQGSSVGPTPGAPTIGAASTAAFFNNTLQTFPFPSLNVQDQTSFRLPQNLSTEIANGTITQAMLNDPNTVLRNHLQGQTITETTTIFVASAPTTPASKLPVPSFGGGTDNIAFLMGDAAAAHPNAQVPVSHPGPNKTVMAGVEAVFWIETVQHILHIPVFQAGQPPLQIKSASPTPAGLPSPTFIVHPPTPITEPRTITVTSKQIQYSQTVLLEFNGLTWPHVSVATLTPAQAIIVPPTAWNG